MNFDFMMECEIKDPKIKAAYDEIYKELVDAEAHLSLIHIWYVIRSMVGGIDSFPLLAVPMFVLAGILMAHGKISEKLFDVFVYFLGNKRAGIPCAAVSYTHIDVYKRQQLC